MCPTKIRAGGRREILQGGKMDTRATEAPMAAKCYNLTICAVNVCKTFCSLVV
jgi:hypothetical protein